MAVAVGSGVSVWSGVGVDVLVEVSEGIAAAVCVDAALAVWTIKVLIAFGSVVGAVAGDAKVGTHAMMSASAVNQIRYFVLGTAIMPLVAADSYLST